MLGIPGATTQEQIANSRHGVDAGLDARGELAALDAIELVVALCILTPKQATTRYDTRIGNSDGRPHAREQHRVQILCVYLREPTREPVHATVRVTPRRPRLEFESNVPTRLLEARRMRGKLQDSDLVEPSGGRVAIRRHAKRWQMQLRRIGE